MKQERSSQVNADWYFSCVTRILTPDNLKTSVVKNSRTENVRNKFYQEMDEYYGTAISSAGPHSPKDKGFVDVVSTWILDPPIAVSYGTKSGHL